MNLSSETPWEGSEGEKEGRKEKLEMVSCCSKAVCAGVAVESQTSKGAGIQSGNPTVLELGKDLQDGVQPLTDARLVTQSRAQGHPSSTAPLCNWN